MQNRRSLASRLFSPAPIRTLRYANYAAVAFLLIFGALTTALIIQLEMILQGIPVQLDDIGAAFALRALGAMKYLIPATLVGIAVFVLFGEMGRSRQMKSEMVAILAQIEMMREGRYAEKRPMRKHDELQPVMDALHDLGDQLEKNTGPSQSR